MSSPVSSATALTLATYLAIPGFGRQTVCRLEQFCQQQQLSLAELWQVFAAGSERCGWTAHLQSVVGLGPAQLRAWAVFRQRWSLAAYQEYLGSQGIQVLSAAQLPPELAAIPHPPLVLFGRGSLAALAGPRVAVVGSRTPTRYGLWATAEVVDCLAAHRLTTISGMMTGIDLAVHQQSLQQGTPSIGILGFGFGQQYPRQLTGFCRQFVAAGNLLLTEYPPGVAPRPGLFHQRNRLVAGLSLAVVVVEARQPSGSLVTADWAKQLGRRLIAVPGPIDSIQSQGTLQLIQEGARLIKSGAEVWEQLYDIMPCTGNADEVSPG